MTKLLAFLSIAIAVICFTLIGSSSSKTELPTNTEIVDAIKEYCWDTEKFGGWYVRVHNGNDSIHRITIIEKGPRIFYDTLWVYPVEGFGVFYNKDVKIGNGYQKSVWYITFLIAKNDNWYVYGVSDTIDVSLLKRARLQ